MGERAYLPFSREVYCSLWDQNTLSTYLVPRCRSIFDLPLPMDNTKTMTTSPTGVRSPQYSAQSQIGHEEERQGELLASAASHFTVAEGCGNQNVMNDEACYADLSSGYSEAGTATTYYGFLDQVRGWADLTTSFSCPLLPSSLNSAAGLNITSPGKWPRPASLLEEPYIPVPVEVESVPDNFATTRITEMAVYKQEALLHDDVLTEGTRVEGQTFVDYAIKGGRRKAGRRIQKITKKFGMFKVLESNRPVSCLENDGEWYSEPNPNSRDEVADPEEQNVQEGR